MLPNMKCYALCHEITFYLSADRLLHNTGRPVLSGVEWRTRKRKICLASASPVQVRARHQTVVALVQEVLCAHILPPKLTLPDHRNRYLPPHKPMQGTSCAFSEETRRENWAQSKLAAHLPSCPGVILWFQIETHGFSAINIVASITHIPTRRVKPRTQYN